MTTLREAAQQALEALTASNDLLGTMYLKMDAAITALRAALAQEEPWTPAKLGDALVQWVDASALAQQEKEDIAQNLQSRLDAALLLEERRQEIAQPRRETEQEPVAWTDRELELIDGMIEVQLHHAAQCDGIANRTMAERQKGWDMERVALLHKIKSISPRREPEQEPVAYTTGLIWRPRQSELVLKVTRSKQERYGFTVPLWTSPRRREWQSLTEEEIQSIHDTYHKRMGPQEFARAIEAALKEKNNG